MRSCAIALVLLGLVGGCHHAGPPAGTTCNGHDELCARSYDAVTFAGTHNAGSNLADHFGAPDQTYGLTRQLDDGIRVLHLEMQSWSDDVYLCHSICEIGSRLLVDGLTEVAAWTRAHRREVVTLLMESTDVSSDDLAARLKKAGLVSSLHVQVAGAPWPTLGQLIDHGDRVIAFNDDKTSTGGATYPWLLSRYTWTWETPWDNEKLADFARCDADRGTAGNSLYVVDNYPEDLIIPNATDAKRFELNPFLIDRLLHCRAASGVRPNFAMVNFYEVSDIFADVDILNGFAALPDDDVDAFPPAQDLGGSD